MRHFAIYIALVATLALPACSVQNGVVCSFDCDVRGSVLSFGGREMKVDSDIQLLLLRDGSVWGIKLDPNGYALEVDLSTGEEFTTNSKFLFDSDGNYVFIQNEWNRRKEGWDIELYNYKGLRILVECVAMLEDDIFYSSDNNVFVIVENRPTSADNIDLKSCVSLP